MLNLMIYVYDVFCIRFRLPYYAFQISVHDKGKLLLVALVFKVEPLVLFA